MGVVPPEDGFLSGLKELTERAGALLVFDEVMSGFRVHPGGAQSLYRVVPDLTILGKVIGGGLPVGAYGGRRDIMAMVAPSGPVYQAGTLSGNPIAMSAGIATLDVLAEPGIWEGIDRFTERLTEGLASAAREEGVPVRINRVGTMFSLFFTDEPVTDWPSAARSDVHRFASYFSALLESGVYIAPSQFEAGFASTEHGDEELETTLSAAANALRHIARS
jgi:glutamate-1-semialdehyde 2,1-aminomutase